MGIERRTEFSKIGIRELLQDISLSRQNMLFKGASKQQIALMEKGLGYRLPASYRRFLNFTNGALLYQTEEFFGTEDDMGDNQLRRSILTVKAGVVALSVPLIPFQQNASCLYCFDADSSKAANREYCVVRLDQEHGSNVVVSRSFTDWLKRLVFEFSASL